jgi:hypothetical protein
MATRPRTPLKETGGVSIAREKAPQRLENIRFAPRRQSAPYATAKSRGGSARPPDALVSDSHIEHSR